MGLYTVFKNNFQKGNQFHFTHPPVIFIALVYIFAFFIYFPAGFCLFYLTFCSRYSSLRSLCYTGRARDYKDNIVEFKY